MKAIKVLISGVALLVLLSGCSSKDNTDSSGGGTPAPVVSDTTTPTPTQPDSFTTTVRGVLTDSPDDAEPVDIDNVEATSPDNEEAEEL